MSETPLASSWISLDSFQHTQHLDMQISTQSLMTTLRVEHGHPFYLKEHLQRITKHACIDLLLRLVSVWLMAYQKEPIARLRMIVVEERGSYLCLQLFKYIPPQGPLRMICCAPPVLMFPQCKTLETLKRASMLQAAQQRGYDDALSCSTEGEVLEATFGNLFWIEEGDLLTPDPTLPYYLGVTLSKLLTDSPWKVKFVKCSVEQIGVKACVFRINALTGPLPISHLEHRAFSQDPQLSAFLHQLWCTQSI